MGNKYIEFVGGKLVYQAPTKVEYVELLSQMNSSLNTKTQMISIKNKILKLTWQRKYKNFYIDSLKCSGIKDIHNKRLQIPVNKGASDKKGFLLGVYYQKNKSWYVLFDNDELSQNNSSSNRSVWIDFIYLYTAMKKDWNIKYQCQQKNSNDKYWVYISSDVNSLINHDLENFKELSKMQLDESKHEINTFLNSCKLTQPLDEEINDFIFKKKIISDKKQEVSFHRNEDKEIGRIGEELFNKLLENGDKLLLKSLKLKEIKKYIWNNEFSESFLPYDFLINDKVFVDIKATTSKMNYFVLSDTEYKFKQSKDESGDRYYIVNVTNVLNENSLKWHFFDSEEIDSISCVEKTERIYGDKYEK